MTDTVHFSNRWVSKDIDFSVYSDNILHINPKEMHIWNKADKDNGTNTLYNNLVIAIQEAQVKDIDSTDTLTSRRVRSTQACPVQTIWKTTKTKIA